MLVAFMSATFLGSSQNSIGLMAGPNYGKTFYTGVGNGTEDLTSFESGFMLGVGYDRVLCESFTFAIHGRYTWAYSSFYDGITDTNFRFRMDVIDLPIQIKYRFGKSNLNFVLGAGPAIAKVEFLDFRWNATGMAGLVTDYKNFNVGLDVNYVFRDISDIFFSDQNGNPIGRAGQNLMFFNLFAKYSFQI